MLEWQRAAQTVELPLEEWIAITLDRAAKVIRRADAAQRQRENGHVHTLSTATAVSSGSESESTTRT